MENKVKIAVIATMSSGKSTLINYFLGRELMPSKSEACTAKIIKINNNSSSEFKFRERNDFEEVSLEKLKHINENESVSEVVIEGKINSFKNLNNIQLIDTPGPNNSQNFNHKEITMKFLQNNLVDVILLILDGSKLLTDDEDYLVQKVIEETKNKINEKNIIFAVNKSDDFKEEDSIEIVKKSIVDKIKSYGFKNPKIHFISAYYAFLNMLNELNYKLTIDQEDELFFIKRKIKRKDFYKASDLSNEIKRKILVKEDELNSKDLIKLKSGLTGLELTLVEMINKINDERKKKNNEDKVRV